MWNCVFYDIKMGDNWVYCIMLILGGIIICNIKDIYKYCVFNIYMVNF